MSKLSVKEEIEYVWNYYKAFIIFGLVVLILLGMFISDKLKDNKTEVLYGIILGNEIELDKVDTLTKELTDYLAGYGSGTGVLDPQNEKITLETTLIVDFDNDTVKDETSQMNLAKISANIFSGDLDFIIGDETVVKHFAGLNALMPAEEYYWAAGDSDEAGDKAADEADDTGAQGTDNVGTQETDSLRNVAVKIAENKYFMVFKKTKHIEQVKGALEFFI